MLRSALLLLSLAVVCAAQAEVPVTFEENAGQTDGEVRFLARSRGYTLYLTQREAVAVLQREHEAPAVVRMRLLNANPAPVVRGEQLQEGRSNYLIGRRWTTNVAHYGRVRLSDVYDGIDVVHYGARKELEYDFVVAPGADPRQIRLQFDGAERIEVGERGDLLLHLRDSVLRHKAPIAYQTSDGKRRPVRAAYRRLGARTFAIDLGTYDATRSLVIDPILVYSTYLGGSGRDFANGIAVDAGLNAYVTGSTNSLDFPTANAVQAAYGGGAFDAFVSKLNAAGTALVYSTYLGGSGSDSGRGIAVDSAGNAYVTGETTSANFPTANPIQAVYAGGTDAFLVKLNAAGSALVYSTYLGGTAQDTGNGVAVDGPGNAYVTGETRSANFPTANALQAVFAGGLRDAFVTKVNAAGSALVYSTYVGGSDQDFGQGIAVDAAGNAAVTGTTISTNFPTANAVQAANGGFSEAFVFKLNAAGSAFLYSTYLGGNGINEFGTGIALDATGNAYVTGTTSSTNFPLLNPWRATLSGANDAFATKLSPTGSLVYSTYLGSNTGYGIAVDDAGTATIAGLTQGDTPTVNPVQAAYGGGTADGFVTRLNPSGAAALYSTYLGGSAEDFATAVDVDNAAAAYVTGTTSSANFPTFNPLQATLRGTEDAFVTKLQDTVVVPPAAAPVPLAGPGVLLLLACALAVSALFVMRRL